MAFEVIMQGDSATIAGLVSGGVPALNTRYVWKAVNIEQLENLEYVITWQLEAE